MTKPDNSLLNSWLSEKSDRIFLDEYNPYSEKEILLDDLISEFNGCKPDELILHFLARNGENSWVSGALGEDQFGLAPRSIFFSIGLLCSGEISFGNNEPNFPEIERKLKSFMDGKREEGIESNGYSEMRSRMLFTSEFVENFQYLESIIRRYRVFEDLLKKEVGFTDSDLEIFLFDYMRIADENSNQVDMDSQINYFYSGIMSLQNLSYDIMSCGEVDEVVRLPNLSEAVDYFEKIKEEYNSALEEVFEVSREEFIERSVLERSKVESILQRLEIEIPSGMSYENPFALNPVEKNPIIIVDDKIYLLQVRNFLQSVNRTLYHDLAFKQDGSLRGSFLDNWGNYLEKWAEEEISEISEWSGREFLPNDNQDMGEIDVAAEIGGCLFLVECKTRDFNIESRDGSSDSLQRDLQRGIGEGTDQLNRLIEKINSGSIEFISNRNQKISVESYSSDDIVPIVVLGSPYDQIGVSEFTDFLSKESFPWVTDIFALQLITRFSSDDEFVDYANKRIDMINSEGEIWAFEELDLYGSYKFGHIGGLMDVNGGDISVLLSNNLSFRMANGARHITKRIDISEEIDRIKEKFSIDQDEYF